MSDHPLPVPAPIVYPETEAFWSAVAEGRFLLPRCRACGLVFWFPRGLCPDCGALDVGWVESSGRGTVYSFTVTRRGAGPYKGLPAYVLAYVELDEGVRVLSNVVGCDPAEVFVGQPVEVCFEHGEDGNVLYRFRPSAV